MDVKGGYRFLRFLLTFENEIVLRNFVFGDMFFQEVQGNIRERDDTRLGVFLGPLLDRKSVV
jgi:hypothetical protein